MRVLGEQQHLREGVVLAGEALARASARAMRGAAGRATGSPVAARRRGSTSRRRSLASRKSTSWARRALRSSSVWIAVSPTIGAISVVVGMSAVESAMPALVVELGASASRRQLVAVADEAREGDLAGDALGAAPARAWPSSAATGVLIAGPHGDERERHAVDLGVLGREHVVRRRSRRWCGGGPADDLLAEELRAEGADAEDVGDGVRVPALGEHRDATRRT